MELSSLLGQGYFPKEVPPPFSTQAYAAVASDLINKIPSRQEWTSPTTLNLARPGTLRRKLAIPNPVTHLYLAQLCVDRWDVINTHLGRSSFSLSTPTPNTAHSDRALAIKEPFGNWARQRYFRMHRGRYVVRADVSNFYGSVYTHAIEWALHTKDAAKASLRGKNGATPTLGSKLDAAVRAAQDGQTKGIPVGPDTSLVLAEVLLSRIDDEMLRKFPHIDGRVLRFMDDLDFYATSRGEAEDFLTELDRRLGHYDLTLNPRKTEIIKGPMAPVASWVIQLDSFDPDRTGRSRSTAVERFFSLAYEVAKEHPSDPVLSWAVSRTSNMLHDDESWQVYQHAILACALSEPSSLSRVIQVLLSAEDRTLDRDSIERTLNLICEHHAPLEHGSEVAWSLYGLRMLSLNLHTVAAAKVAEMKDNCSLLLLMDLIMNGNRIHGSPPSLDSIIATAESSDAPSSESWLLAYESARNGWSDPSFFHADSTWSHMLNSKVSFFETHDPVVSTISAISPKPVISGFWGGNNVSLEDY